MAQWTETLLAAVGTVCLMAGAIGWLAVLGAA